MCTNGIRKFAPVFTRDQVNTHLSATTPSEIYAKIMTSLSLNFDEKTLRIKNVFLFVWRVFCRATSKISAW